MGTQFALERSTALQLLAHVYCGQTAGWIKMALGTEVYLGPDHIVFTGTKLSRRKGHSSPPLFGPCLLWLNGRPSQLLLSSCIEIQEVWSPRVSKFAHSHYFDFWLLQHLAPHRASHGDFSSTRVGLLFIVLSCELVYHL